MSRLQPSSNTSTLATHFGNYPEILKNPYSNVNPPSAQAVAQALEILFASFLEENKANQYLLENDSLGTGSDDLRTRRSRIDKRVETIRTCVGSLNAEAVRRTTRLLKERNATISFHKLPVELHTSILRHAVKHHDTPVQRLLDLSTIATNWWNLIKNAPSLWTTIRTDQKGVALALSRSKNAPLDIFLEVQGEEDEDTDFDTILEDLAATASMLKPHVRRWRSANIHSWSFTALAELLEMSLPLLQTIEIEATDGPDDDTDFHFPGGSLLRTINLRGVHFWFTESPLTRLENISISDIELDQLEWVSSLLTALARCPRLAELRLIQISRGVRANPSQGAPRLCPLPSLKVLELSFVCSDVLLHLFESLRVQNRDLCCTIHPVPHLQPNILDIFSRQDSEEGAIGDTFVKAVRSDLIQVEVSPMSGSISINTLLGKFSMVIMYRQPRQEVRPLAEYLAKVAPDSCTWLTLDGQGVLQDQLAVLDTFPNITSLRIGSYEESHAALEYLMAPVGPRCPKLETIYLFWEVDDLPLDENLLAGFLEKLKGLKRLRPDIGVCDGNENSYGEDMRNFLGMDFPLVNQDL